jgi:hypothetical protein
MKNKTENPKEIPAYKIISKSFLTGFMLLSITTGCIIGSFATQAFSQSDSPATECTDSTTLMSIPINGETLPTMMLNEFAVIADQAINK